MGPGGGLCGMGGDEKYVAKPKYNPKVNIIDAGCMCLLGVDLAHPAPRQPQVNMIDAKMYVLTWG